MTLPVDRRTVWGDIFDIQRMSIHDGPGIRTAVFLKGCPLRCLWCHNPEGWSPRPELAFSPSLCIGCGHCFRVCPSHAHSMKDEAHELDRTRCVQCFACAEQCYAGALETIGKRVQAGEVLAEVEKDRPFYEESGGGLTVSGGEPLAQPEFTRALVEEAKALGLHTCVETCGVGPLRALLDIAGCVDLFLFDYKETSPQRHIESTGFSRDVVLQSLYALDAAGAAIILRCPIVPGVNLREEHLRGIVEVARSVRGCLSIHVIAYHGMGESKRQRLGLEATELPRVIMPRADAETVARRLRELGARKVEVG